MAYDIDFDHKGEMLLHIRKFLLYPKNWVDPNNRIIDNLNWDFVKFQESEKHNIPEKKGVYCFVLEPQFDNFIDTKYLFYIGRTIRTLKIRYKEYLDDLKGKGKPRPKIFEMLKLYNGFLSFFYTEIEDDDKIDEIEEKLLNTFVPFVNTDIPIAKIKPELNYIYGS